MQQRATIKDWFVLFSLTIFWGTSFVFNELALAAVPPSVLVMVRLLLGFLVLLAALLASRQGLPRPSRAWLPWLVIALLGTFLPMRLTAWAQLFIGSAETGVLMAITPLMVFALSWIFLPQERASGWQFLSLLFGFAGVFLLVAGDMPSGLRNNPHLFGLLAVLVAAFCYAMNSVYARRFAASQSPLVLATGTMLLASLLTAPAALADLSMVLWPLPLSAVVALLMLGLVSTGLASVLYFRLVQGPGPVFTAQVTYGVPAWAVLAAAWVLQEPIGTRILLGLALILLGVALTEWGGRRSRWRALPLADAHASGATRVAAAVPAVRPVSK